MRQYSIDNVNLSWLGLDFKEGLAAGASITEARNASAWSIKPTGQGRAVRVYNPDRTGTVSVVVDQESQLHQDLLTIAAADRNPATRDQVGTMLLTDNTSGESVEFRNAFIMTEPDLSRGTESTTFTWVFGFEDRYQEPVNPVTNLVGS